MDTEEEIRRDRYIDEHLGMCATCYWKERTVCRCESSDWCDDRVSDNFACEEWIARKGVL